MKTNLYQYNELSDEAKEKAREWYRSADCGEALHFAMECHETNDGVTFYEWSTYPHILRIDWRNTDPVELAMHILHNHGRTCDTYKETRSFIRELHNARKEWQPEYYDTEDLGNGELPGYKRDWFIDESPDCDDAIQEYKYAIEQCYAEILRKEDECLSSDEYVEDTIIASGCDFTEDGSIA
jgi:hypothetical protein